MFEWFEKIWMNSMVPISMVGAWIQKKGVTGWSAKNEEEEYEYEKVESMVGQNQRKTQKSWGKSQSYDL